ncbi:hypothetical protein J2785_002083 [Burkholderia ambifaria]|nr:hypothetical protein [Burkholderia ambifaria]
MNASSASLPSQFLGVASWNSTGKLDDAGDEILTLQTG